jgi:hypothetical protein
MGQQHAEQIRDQFTRQAVPFATAAQIRNEAWLNRIVEMAQAGPADTVLDVACGPGLLACAFARVTKHVTGIDLTPRMLDQAKALQRQLALDNLTWHDGVVDRLAARAKRVATGPGDAADSEMGPVITCAARDRITGLIDKGVSEGATLVVDGRKPNIPGHPSGFFVGPTLFDRVTPAMAIYREEIFGPVLCVVRAESLTEAIALINGNPYANGAALFTRSGHAARRFEQGVEVGMAGINVPIPVPMAFYSFGGWRNSLFGDLNVHGTDGVRFYTRLKTVTSRWPDDGSAAPGFHMPLMG